MGACQRRYIADTEQKIISRRNHDDGRTRAGGTGAQAKEADKAHSAAAFGAVAGSAAGEMRLSGGKTAPRVCPCCGTVYEPEVSEIRGSVSAFSGKRRKTEWREHCGILFGEVSGWSRLLLLSD